MPEYHFNPSQLLGMYEAAQTATADGEITKVQTDTYGNLYTIKKGSLFASTALFSGSVFASASTFVLSDSTDVSPYLTKSIYTYIGGGAGGSVTIQVDPVISGTFYNYSSSVINSNVMSITTLTDAVGLIRVSVLAASANSTITSYLVTQA